MVLDFIFQAVPHVKMWGDKWQKESKAMCVLFPRAEDTQEQQD